MLVSALSYRSLPTDYGVYQFLNEKGKVIYVGKAINLKKRVSSYFSSKDLGDKTKRLVLEISQIRTIQVQSEIEAFLLEERLIKKYKPQYNIKLMDGKSYLGLKITIKDEYPKVLLSRIKDNDNALYFGPFTSSNSLKIVLKILRKIFPFQAVLNHPNTKCLYFYLGLCPCPSITKDINYKKNINHIIDFLNGNTKKLIKNLENERDTYSKIEDFEKAGKTQKQIDAIKLITSAFYKPFEYEDNPNLKSDVIRQELNELKVKLQENNVKVDNLLRIECFDISNISGTNPVGSMVVFTNGEKDSSSYRRFKIKNDYNNKPNDFAMMQEMLERRLNRHDWPKPSLIIIDGGKGQVSAIKEVLENLNLNYPLIGLAKRDEIIITSDFKEIKLDKSSKILHLIMRIRDEAHRFAITYHKKLRSKNFLKS